ncbi:MAG TPA: hypothetical protein VGM26_03690 [Rhizomicrobium sp.]|jgi:anti-sigma factor RsiW
MSGTDDISDIDLHAYIDGALDASRVPVMEARLAADPTLATRLAAFRADKARLKRVYTSLDTRSVPPEWIALARGHKQRSVISLRVVGAIAAVFVIMLAGAVAWRMTLPVRPYGVVEAALDARGNGTADRTIAVANATEARRFDALLSETVAARVKVPDMQRMGYRLTGIRLYGGSDRRAAELRYLDSSGRVFTLYLRRSNGVVRFDQFERAGLRVCVWQDDRVSMVMAGNVSTAAMQRLASLAYTGLTA